ncbi:hypothetical protein [Methylomicrobium lacus]|uniref:hypothetical protein n=1 Tax=Methylomicrobium lacus TaxID=136992 RepID=UPI0035A8CF66
MPESVLGQKVKPSLGMTSGLQGTVGAASVLFAPSWCDSTRYCTVLVMADVFATIMKGREFMRGGSNSALNPMPKICISSLERVLLGFLVSAFLDAEYSAVLKKSTMLLRKAASDKAAR